MRRAMIVACVLAAVAAAPATKPASQPAAAESYPAMQRRLADLTREVEQLRAENQQLKSELDAQAARAAKPGVAASRRDLPRTADELRDAFHDAVKTGMTLDACKSVLGEPVSSSREGDSMTYLFAQGNPVPAQATSIVSHRVWCTFEDGHLVDCREDRSTTKMKPIKAETR